MWLRSRRVVALAVTAVIAVAGPAMAATWASNGSGKARATANVLAAPAGLSASASGSNVTVSVTVAPTSGPTPTAYRVDRTGPGSTFTANVCTITATAGVGSCTDRGTANKQTYTYTVYSRIGSNWLSATAATSLPVTA